MAKRILQLDELQDANGWSIYSPKDIGKIGNQWYTPARALGLAPVDYIQMLIRDFKPDFIKFLDSSPNGLLLFSWKSQVDMRKFKNWLNKRLREVKFYVE